MLKIGCHISGLMFVVMLAATIGCGSSGPSTLDVSGTVTYRGTAIEGATVSFSPSVEKGQSAVGTTDDEGRFVLTTFQRGDGAIAGDYKVRVFKYDSPRQDAEEIVSDEDYVPPRATDRPPPAPKHVLPDDYAYESRTPLEFTVETGRDNVFDISIN